MIIINLQHNLTDKETVSFRHSDLLKGYKIPEVESEEEGYEEMEEEMSMATEDGDDYQTEETA